MLELGIKFLLSYFLGSIMGSMLLGRMRGGIDIRTMGSGNAGGTNALRTQGIVFGLGVVLIDIGKGAFATAMIPQLDLPLVGQDPTVSREWLALCCAAAAVMGHVWPIWYDFKGGKGAATLFGTLAVLASWLLLPVLLVWLWMLMLFGYVGLATMTAAVFAPAYVALTRFPAEQPLFVYGLGMAVYIVLAHRSNIERMLAGTEFQNSRLMLLRRFRGRNDDDAT